MRYLGLIFMVVTATASCMDDPSFSEPGVIISYGDTSQITAPTSVGRGVPFQVSVQTFAGGCTRTIARTELKVSGGIAEIRPFNETTKADVCFLDLILLTHTVTITGDQAGTLTIRVIGEQEPVATGGTGPAQIDRRVTVQ